MTLDEYVQQLTAQRERYRQPKITRIVKQLAKKPNKPRLKPKTFKP